MCGAQLGTISVGLCSKSTCTKVCRIGRWSQLGAIGPNSLGPALGEGITIRYITIVYKSFWNIDWKNTGDFMIYLC